MNIVIAILATLATVQDAPVAPDAWVHQGDSDGDGLSDEFELAHGLDPHRVSSFADGIADEDRIDASGKTLWEVQQAAATPERGGACGLTGIEVLVMLGFLRRRRKAA
jgi:hypothetical protein